MKQAITYTRLSAEEREEISRGLGQGQSYGQIALKLSRETSTISRELSRLRYNPMSYRATFAQEVAVRKRKHPKTHKLQNNEQLRSYVEDKLLNEHWSPQQIAARIKLEYPSDMTMRVSHETIYTYIFCLARGSLKKELKATLRQHKYSRGRRPPRGGSHKDSNIPDLVSIEERPKEVEDRIIPGHWEGDLIMGRGNHSALGTLVERTMTLAARSTAIGTLELFCVAKEGGNRWRLEFNIRDLVKPPPAKDAADGEPGASATGESTVTDVWPEAQVQEAARLIREVYAGQGETTPQDLTKALETALDSPRHEWPTGLCRRLWEFLSEVADERRRSPAHLTRWSNLVGYCLRPGFGDPLDRFRIEQLWKMMAAPPRPGSARVQEGGADFWILWRRVAGGLNPTLQRSLYERLRPALLPGKGKAGVKPNANELAEMWRAAASLERLDVKAKEALGDALLKPLKRSPTPTYGFWSLTRLGARALIYGPLNAVVHPQTAERWLDAILGFEPGNPSERLGWAFCLSQLARRTGQRALDVDDSHRRSVLAALSGQEVPAHWVRMVEEVSELEQEEQGQMLGDSLPIGLRLLKQEE